MLSYFIFFWISSYYSFFKLMGRTRAPPQYLLFVSEIRIYKIFRYAGIEYLHFIKEGLKAIFDMLRSINKNIWGIVTHADSNRGTGNGFDYWAPWGAQYFVEHRAPQCSPIKICVKGFKGIHPIEYNISKPVCTTTINFLYDNEITKFIISRIIRVSEILNVGRPGVPQIKLAITALVDAIILNLTKTHKHFFMIMRRTNSLSIDVI